MPKGDNAAKPGSGQVGFQPAPSKGKHVIPTMIDYEEALPDDDDRYEATEARLSKMYDAYAEVNRLAADDDPNTCHGCGTKHNSWERNECLRCGHNRADDIVRVNSLGQWDISYARVSKNADDATIDSVVENIEEILDDYSSSPYRPGSRDYDPTGYMDEVAENLSILGYEDDEAASKSYSIISEATWDGPDYGYLMDRE